MQLDFLYYILLSLYMCTLLVVCAYGFHRYMLVYLYYKFSDHQPRLRACFIDLPRVTIQLPMFNERFVARRIIERACAVDYPRDRLQIQVLDDSTDDTTEIARSTVERLQAEGHDVVLCHRDNREGYKAGALQEGMESAKGEFVLIFDADFIPPPNVLRDTIHFLTDPEVGMVQARWTHVNRGQSMLTKAQAILLDGHFVMEHGARNRSGRFMSFNGTAGIWRRSCIEDAGGWQHDTLTEDLDLSYRAQLKGWKFLFLPDAEVPAELPPEISAFKAQQYRWTKGGAQTCKKLLPAILKSDLSWKIKLEAFYHLTSNTVYAFVVVLTVLLFPALYLKWHVFQHHMLARYILDGSLLLLATFSASTFYICCQRELGKSWWESIRYLPLILGLGIGIALNNARAVLHGFFGQPSEFVRTPKYGVTGGGGSDISETGRPYSAGRNFELQPWIELAMGLYLSACVVACLTIGRLMLGIPFLTLFALGYLYVSLSTFRESWRMRRLAPAELPAASIPS